VFDTNEYSACGEANLELETVNGADHAVGQVQRSLRDGILGKVVVRFVLVHIFGWGDDPKCRVVLLKQLALALEGAGDQRLSGSVVLVGEANVGHAAWGTVGVDEDLVVSLHKAIPLKVGGYLGCIGRHVSVHGACLLSLVANDLVELSQAVLKRGDEVSLELGKVVLDGKNVAAVVVLFDDLLVQTVEDSALDHVGVLVCVDLATGAVKGSRVLAELLNVLLRRGASLVYELAALAGALGELFGLVLDLGVKAFEDGQDGALECLGSLGMRVGDALDRGLWSESS
jgi:hypothetical protein